MHKFVLKSYGETREKVKLLQPSTISNSLRYDKLRCKHPFAMVGRGMQNLGLYSELTSGRRDLYRAKTSVTRDFGVFFCGLLQLVILFDIQGIARDIEKCYPIVAERIALYLKLKSCIFWTLTFNPLTSGSK